MRRALTIFAAALVLAACGKAPDERAALDALDNQLTANDATPAGDPVLQAALKDQIMVDPGLTQQANADVVRPPTQPVSGAVPPDAPAGGAQPAERDRLASTPAPGPCPQCAAARRALTLGALAQSQSGGARQCAPNVAYSAGWANRLPAGIPLYPDARVLEAAGADGAGCALRVVSFASAAPLQRLLDWYYTKATAAGFAPQHGLEGSEHLLAGRKAGGAMLAMLRPRSDGGTDVDLMVDGR